MNRKIALITGASRGIGKKVAEEFAKNGYDIVANYVSDNTDLEQLEKDFKELGAKVLFVKTDVTNFEDCKDMVKAAIDAFGRIDVLVNNAGITKDGLLMRMKEEDFDKVININLKGTFNVTRNVVPYMVKQKSGNIVNISSVVGICRKCRSSKLRSIKSGNYRFYKNTCKRACFKKYKGKRSSTRFY